MSTTTQALQDIKNERSKASFHVETMTNIIYDQESLDTKVKPTTQRINIKRKVKEAYSKDPVISKPEQHYFLSREDQFSRCLDVVSRVINIKKNLGLVNTPGLEFHRELGHEMPLLLHDVVFAGCIKSLASDEQLKEWLPKILNYQWIGSYSQTELGHGSNVASLETTIHYIEETDEFEINSPSLTSTKWWIGALGKISTHTIVFGQLWLKEKATGELKNYGVHPVLVQIRSLDDHIPLKGVEVGDIGPKFGFNMVDNGYLRLDKFKVPRSNLLSRFFQVTRQGHYIAPPHPRLVYAGMVGVRAHLIEDSFTQMAKAITIATRYSIVRRQFKTNSIIENMVLNYGSQQMRIFPSIAATYAFAFMGKRLYQSHVAMMTAIKKNHDVSRLSELHSLSSGLKSLCTTIACKAIDDCRLACGGHGYSNLSGLPTLYAGYAHVLTAEGENNILPQQTARYLLKVFKDVLLSGQTKVGETVQYLVNESNDQSHATLEQFLGLPVGQFATGQTLLKPEVLLKLYTQRSFSELARLAFLLQDATANGDDLAQTWTELNTDCIRVSHAYCQVYILSSFFDEINRLPTSPSKDVLVKLAQLYALVQLETSAGDFLRSGFLLPKHIDTIRGLIPYLLRQLRPDALPLVEAFEVSDLALASAIGRSDGKAYETLFNLVKSQPFNQPKVVDGFNQYLQPIIKSKL
ncbi:acyl-CoA oxidase [Cavenderia fasciculata]|uniref:Acyl-coenzyme A oxidase n=1 Tax=Cavenderia fasciculata TaxID=261658 RepID=F4Q0M3_CACFS|nr:acyl-CoA oxidase [Cavenderia fasciculata]EGG18374.1 acyl-CoA oxidase [Cavenderia fasciculata]|eukprot:XP_004366278.1 acyl-CoA oxidase [Cavenderia fasciculata]